MSTSQSEIGFIRRLVLKHVREAFVNQDAIEREWRGLNFTAPPDWSRAIDQYDRFVELVSTTGALIEFLPAAAGTGMDSIYVRDASIMTDRGAVLCRMGKPQRDGEPAAQEAAFRAAGVAVLGAIDAPGRLEGGDVVWLNARTLAVGQGYRSNADGIRQLRDRLGDQVDEVITVPLPHWRGPSDAAIARTMRAFSSSRTSSVPISKSSSSLWCIGGAPAMCFISCRSSAPSIPIWRWSILR